MHTSKNKNKVKSENKGNLFKITCHEQVFVFTSLQGKPNEFIKM